MEGAKWLRDLEVQLSGIVLSKDEEEISKKHSIHRVPARIKDASIKSYEPQMVSIGPYHHGKPNLQLMEHHKRRVLAQFLKRTGRSIREYAEALDPVLEDLMGAYEQLDEEWRNKERFLPLMLIDGCFLLQTMHRTGWRFEPFDPILGLGALTPMQIIQRDILMLENQIPLLALARLRSVEVNRPIREVEMDIQYLPIPGSDQIRGEPVDQLRVRFHILDIYREELIFDPRPCPSIINYTTYYQSVPSVTKLHEAGVVFRSSTESTKRYIAQLATYITFENGVLTLPILEINELKGVLYRNITAFERRHPDNGYDFSTCWAFIFGLVNSVQDVALLRSQGLIVNELESDEAVLELINELGKDAAFDRGSRLYGIFHSLNVYYEKKTEKWSKRFREWRLNLKQNYFSNPWTAISVFAAAFLLLLTLVQTYCSVRSCNKTN